MPQTGLPFALFIVPLLTYIVIGFVVWKFYQMISKISDDLAEIKTLLERREGTLGVDLEIPPNPLT
jgi:hypothetical protein